MVKIRKYRREDFEAVLNLLNQSCEFDDFSAEILEEKLYSDPFWNVDSTFIAEKNAVILGFLQGVLREIRAEKFAYIKLMVVNKSSRRAGVATAMLKEMEAYMVSVKVDRLRIYDVPLNYFMPGVDPRYTEAVCFALKHGFERNGEAVNMDVDLQARSWDTVTEIDKLQKEGIKIGRAEEDDLDDILSFLKKEWELWQYEIRMAMESEKPSVFIARKNGEVKGFAAYDGNNKGTGWFGPMGTDEVFRGKGIGRVLLYKCLEDMKLEGHKEAIIPWVAPISFYSHYCGAKISRTFWRFEKRMSM